jgi:hypothetical protein
MCHARDRAYTNHGRLAAQSQSLNSGVHLRVIPILLRGYAVALDICPEYPMEVDASTVREQGGRRRADDWWLRSQLAGTMRRSVAFAINATVYGSKDEPFDKVQRLAGPPAHAWAPADSALHQAKPGLPLRCRRSRTTFDRSPGPRDVRCPDARAANLLDAGVRGDAGAVSHSVCLCDRAVQHVLPVRQ